MEGPGSTGVVRASSECIRSAGRNYTHGCGIDDVRDGRPGRKTPRWFYNGFLLFQLVERGVSVAALLNTLPEQIGGRGASPRRISCAKSHADGKQSAIVGCCSELEGDPHELQAPPTAGLATRRQEPPSDEEGRRRMAATTSGRELGKDFDALTPISGPPCITSECYLT